MLQVANAPCSWGVIENVEGERYDYVRVLNEMQQTGYIGTELGDWGFMPTDPDKLRAELDARDFVLLGSWVNVFLHDQSRHDESVENAVRTAKLMAAVQGSLPFIVLGNDAYGDPVRNKYAGRIQPEHGMSDPQWDVFIKGVERVAREVKEASGLRTILHPHIGTVVETPAETDRFLDMADPDLVGIVFDTGHFTFGGGDLVQAIKRYSDRIWHVHFKDCEPNVAAQSREHEWAGLKSVEEGVFCELGMGAVDFPAVLNALESIGYDSWIVVEQDVLPGMGTPMESAARNRAYLHSIGI